MVACRPAVRSASVSRCQARARSLRAIAVVAIFLPRRRAIACVGGGVVGVPPGGLRGLAQDPSQPRRALLGDVAVPDGAVRAADGRGEPGPGGQLARRAEPGDVTDLGEDDQRGEVPDAGQLRQDLDPRVGPGALADLDIEPVDRDLQGIDQRQVVLDHLPRDRRERERGEPAPAGPAPAAGRPVMTVVGQDSVDPVAQQRPQPHQLGAVPQQRPQLPHRRRRDPRLREQVRAEQLRQDRGVDLIVFQPRAAASSANSSGVTRSSVTQ